MVAELYDALIDAGASEEKARTAARAMADYNSRFDQIDQKLAEINGKINLIQWMLALVIVASVTPTLKALFN
ncbi:MAG: integrase [Gammaproteobacteria bacterium]|nr:integrase [Gammaproteobacteria bacterium]MBT4606629.1 integrase [Thiotrichales bacterium]MBT5466648.1 integrase [Candidatus Neomarinimicrobiota bacterium]MBT5688635.1 integrase [Gammaproteobacteria bacterium]MBT7023436.1 integrase [Gammaproteobacteria bacterium]